MSYEIQFTKITNSGKLPDRFLTSQHLNSPDLAKASMGDVFSLIEIFSPWFPTAQVGKLIINNFAKYYYEDGSTSDLVNFENALKRLNEDLAQITQEGETDWIGNLNGILAAIVGNNLHFTPTGVALVYIFRDGKVNHLTEGLSSEGSQIHPLKTFSNVISGELKNHDKILIANKELFNHLSMDSVQQIITLNGPAEAGMQISKLLHKERVKNVNLIIINLVLKEELSNLPQEESASVFYLDKANGSFIDKTGAITILKSFGNLFGGFIGKFKPKKGTPKIVATAESLKKISESPLKKESVTSKDQFKQEFMDSPRDDGLLRDEEIKYSPDLYIHYYDAETKRGKSTFIQKAFLTIKNSLIWLWSKLKDFSRFILKTARDPARRKYLFISIAILLIIIIALFVTLRGRGNKLGNLQAQKILDEAMAAQKDGKSSESANNAEEAKNQYLLSITKAKTIINNPLVAKDAQNVIASSYQELDKLTSTTRFNDLSPQITNSNNVNNLFIIGGEAYLVDETDIYKASLLGGSPSKIASIPKGKGNISFGTLAGNIIYLYASDQTIYELDTTTDKLNQVKIAQDGHWETANAIANYIGSIYLLDGVLGQIYKHNSSAQTFAAGEAYITSANIDLKQSISIAVDGSIYVLKSNGKVLKIQKSKLQDFSLKNIPSPFSQITKPVKIFTDSDTPSIYILDSDQKRIIEFDKDGVFVHQYALPFGFDKIKDFIISAKSRKIWVLQNNSLYEISI